MRTVRIEVEHGAIQVTSVAIGAPCRSSNTGASSARRRSRCQSPRARIPARLPIGRRIEQCPHHEKRVQVTLEHRVSWDRVPLDLGGSVVTGMHVDSVYKLRQALQLDPPVRR